jgi:fumarate hydratase subunit beta
MHILHINTPLDTQTIDLLKSGDQVFITGIIFTARDAAHKRLITSLDKGENLPFDLKNQIIYYMGPAPAKLGQVIGSAGPTTSGRMDIYTPRLLKAGLRGMIGKGGRSQSVKAAIQQYKAIYFAAIGGAGALISKTIKKAEVIAYEDLGPESIRKLDVVDFPAVVINDVYGGDLYVEGKARYCIAP